MSAGSGKQKQISFQVILSGYLLALILFSFAAPAQAQILPNPINTNTNNTATSLPQYNKGVDTSIKDYLCVPDDSNLGGALYTCISRVYRFGVAFGAIALVFFIVYAGYMYMVGGEAAKGKAKSMIWSALTGMGIILGSYVLLRFINPSLVEFKSIQPPIFTAVLPSCQDAGFGVNCILSDGTVHTAGTGSGATGNVTGKGGAVCNAGTDTRTNEHANCNIPANLKAAITQASQANNLDPTWIEAIIQQESQWKEDAVGPLTQYGHAYGLMQMLESTASAMGCSGSTWKTDGVTNIKCGAKYMAQLRDRYGASTLRLIAAGYNAGPGRLTASSNCPGQQVWECPFDNSAQSTCNTSFNQTRNYVVSVARFQQEFSACR